MPKTPPSRDVIRRAFKICLRNYRLETGIAQERLAYQAEIDRAYMSGLERGRHSPSLQMIYRLAPVLNVTFLQFVTEFDRTVRRLRREDVPAKVGD